MQLLPEIYRQIIREATCVPAALDTSHEATISEDRGAVAAAVQLSMDCKLALCLVSKAMHELAQEFLYEIITIREYKHIRPLVLLLNASDGPQRPKRGWWCRRLEIASLGECPQVYCGQNGRSPYAWKWGKHSLWGLIPACPRLSVFISHTQFIQYGSQQNRSPAGSTSPPPTYRFPLPTTLFKSIASACAPTLRRMEWRDQTIVSLDILEQFLRHSSSLEVCRVMLLAKKSEFGLEDGADFPNDNGAMLDRTELDEYKLAMKAEWPTVYGDSGIVLPELHTLDLGPLPPEAASWSLPIIRSLGNRYTYPYRPPFHTVDLKTLASQLTHLAYKANNDFIWDIVRTLPNLTSLSLWTQRPIPLTPEPYPTITCINLYATAFTGYSLKVLELAALRGHLMSLHTVKVWGYTLDRRDVYHQIFTELGVSLESSRELGSGPWS